MPVFDTEPDTGFGVDLGETDWAVTGLVTSLRKARRAGLRREIDVQALTDVNTKLVKILATPDREQSGASAPELGPIGSPRPRENKL